MISESEKIAKVAIAIRDLLEDGHKVCYRCPLVNIVLGCWHCRKFMRVPHESRQCPCGWYGKEEAAKRAWIYLEEGGYLDG